MSAQTIYTSSSIAHTISGNSGILLVGNFTELAIDCNTTAVSGTSPTLQFFIDRLGTDGIYYNIWSSSSRNTAGTDSASIGAGLTQAASFAGTIQFRWVIGGTSPSFTFSFSLQGK